MLNNTHCSSSQEFDEVSRVLRTIALAADTTTATRISHARRFPVQRVNASIPRLTFRSDCNDRSSIRIDIVNNLLPKRVRDIIDLIGHAFFLLPLTIVMVITGGPFFVRSYGG